MGNVAAGRVDVASFFARFDGRVSWQGLEGILLYLGSDRVTHRVSWFRIVLNLDVCQSCNLAGQALASVWLQRLASVP